MAITLAQLKAAFAKSKITDPLGGMPELFNLPKDEHDEYRELIQITQNATGEDHIASNGNVMQDPLVAPFRERMRDLIERDKQISVDKAIEDADLAEQAETILDKIRARRTANAQSK